MPLALLRLPARARRGVFGDKFFEVDMTATCKLPRPLSCALLVLVAGSARTANAAEGPAKEIVASADAPKAIGPYSQAVKAGGMVFLAGQVGLDPKTGQLVKGGIEEQTERALENIKAVLAASGLTLEQVVMSTCYLKNMDDFAKFNAAYGKHFPHAPPARATVEVARLPKDALVEVAVIAVR